MSNQPIDIVRNDLATMEVQFQAALPPHITPERFVRVAMTAIQSNPDLLTADRKTLYGACMKCAQDGLVPDGREAALVIYRAKDGVKAQYMPMITGILKKVRNSGELASITAQMIFQNDKFRYWVDDTGEHLEHDPLLFGGKRGNPIGVYALAKTKDGAVYIEVMTSEQVMAVKASSRAANGPWNGAFEHEMWRKTALRRLSKRLPMSSDLSQVVERDDEMYDINAADAALPDKGKRLAAMIELQPTQGEGTPVAETGSEGG